MDTRVKERLVGAAVLVGILVALVPEMLSGPRQQDPAPASGDQVRTYTIDLSRDAGAAGPPREVLPDDPPVIAPAPAPDAAAEEESAATTAPASPAPSEPRTTAQPRPTPPKSEAPAAPRSPQPASPGVDPGWAVQLGSFASQENADRLARDLRQRGYKAFVSRFDSGKSVRHRVRVGPEQDRAKAEALAQRLRRDGQQVSIVEHP